MTTQEEITDFDKKQLEVLKERLKKCDHTIKVFNSFRGRNWDNTNSKGFILAYPYLKDDGILIIEQLNPRYFNKMGWKTHYKKSYAENGLFYDGVLGMSRAFNIVYNLSSWLFKDLSKEEVKQICGKDDAGYILHNE